ncbi:eukaryotic translation elongation factor 1 epsilon-1 [Leptopilina boulardi]|uniref:eukaryotic translation elongation factor 1 epsilon-1 n=1 Tax=Leptopilina boulardi TaxID=63433 RepID=UPI0021F54EC2|nr:eukaryotic translation elongation factor 1 epsilon-1 [Leptopilina boulardi]
MVLCNIKCVQRISKYLDVTPGKVHMSENNVVAMDNLIKNQSIEGFSTIVQALTSSSNLKNLLGDDAVSRALTQQWLEYASVCANYADNSANTKRVLKEMNTFLKSTTYLGGTKLSVADVSLYYILHSIMRDLTPLEKREYIHVSRWFENLQNDEKIRQKLELINLNIMYMQL